VGFLDGAIDSGLLGGLTAFGDGYLKGMDKAEDRKQKQLEFKAKYEADKIDKEKKANEESFSRASSLRKEWEGNATTKNSQIIKSSYDKIKGTSSSPAGDMSLAFAYMKMLDPTSTVREGEQAQVRDATSVLGRAQNMYNNILTGGKLRPEQRANFINEAGRLYQSQLRGQRDLDEQFGGLADTYKINRNEVVLKIFEDPQTGQQKIVQVPANSPAAQALPDAPQQQPKMKAQGLIGGKAKQKDKLDSMSDAEIERLYKQKMGGG
jgi:hypothetical protein